MGGFKNLTGQKFGKLTAIKRASNKGRRTRWLCKCDCGKERSINYDSLIQGHSKSCGCLQRENAIKRGRERRLPLGIASMGQCFYSYKVNAKRKGLLFVLTKEQFHRITQQDCYYCGAKPNNVAKAPNNNGDYIYNGLDRVDNTKGYTLDNVVPCCKICNNKKSAMTLQEFKDWIQRVYNRFRGGEKNS